MAIPVHVHISDCLGKIGFALLYDEFSTPSFLHMFDHWIAGRHRGEGWESNDSVETQQAGAADRRFRHARAPLGKSSRALGWQLRMTDIKAFPESGCRMVRLLSRSILAIRLGSTPLPKAAA